MIPKHTITKINGINTILVPFKSNTISIAMAFNMGHFDENEKSKGLTHFIEHLLATSIRECDVMKEYQKKGIFINCNAYTDLFNTGYFLNSDPRFFNKALKLIIDSFINFKVNSENYNREKESIIVEMTKKMNDPIDKTFSVILPDLLFKNKNLIRDPKVHIDNIYNITPKQVELFYKKNYNLRSGVLVLSGDFNVSDAKKIINSYKLQTINKLVINRTITPKKYNSYVYKFIEDKNLGLVQIIYNFKVFDSNNKNKYIIKMISTMLDDIGSKSILFSKLRIKLGITYSPYSRIYTNQYYGIFSIIVEVVSKNIDKANKEIFDILKKFKNFSDEDSLIQLAKSRLKYDILIMNNDNNSSFYINYGDKFINKIDIISLNEIYKKYYDKVDSKKIKNLSNTIFNPNNLIINVIHNKRISDKFTIFKDL